MLRVNRNLYSFKLDFLFVNWISLYGFSKLIFMFLSKYFFECTYMIKLIFFLIGGINGLIRVRLS